MALGVAAPPLGSPGQWRPNRLTGIAPRTSSGSYGSADTLARQAAAESTGSGGRTGSPSAAAGIYPGHVAPEGTTQTVSYQDPTIAAYNAWLQQQQSLGQTTYNNNLAYQDALYGMNTGNAQTNSALAMAMLQGDKYRTVDLGLARNAVNAGFVNRGFGIDMNKANLQLSMNKRGAESDAAGRGAFSSQGFNDTISDIYQQFYNARDTAELGRDKALSDINFDNKALKSLANDYGLREKDISNKLQQTITQLGLDYNQTVATLNAQLNSGNQQLALQALNFMQQMMLLGPSSVPSISVPSVPSAPSVPTSTGPALAGGAGGAGAGAGGGGGGRPISYR